MWQFAGLIGQLNNAQDPNKTTGAGIDLQTRYNQTGFELGQDPALVSTADPGGMGRRIMDLYQSDKWFRDDLLRKFFKPQAVESIYSTLKERPPTGGRLVWATTGPQPGPPDPALQKTRAMKMNTLFNARIVIGEALDLPVCEKLEQMETASCVKLPFNTPKVPVLKNIYSKLLYMDRLLPKGDFYRQLRDYNAVSVQLVDSDRPRWMSTNRAEVTLYEGRVVGVYLDTRNLSYRMTSAVT